MMYFGINVQPGKYGLNICRDKYATISKRNTLKKFDSISFAYADEKGAVYKDEWCNDYQHLCLINYDLNMQYFSSLNHKDFEHALQHFLDVNPSFEPVYDLSMYDNVSGYYMMVLDAFCQVYIGVTHDIRARIKQHWTQQKSFDRLLFPMYAVETSRLSIDSFRALDTTRIFASTTQKPNTKDEDLFIFGFDPKFVLNRLCSETIPDDKSGLLKTGDFQFRR